MGGGLLCGPIQELSHMVARVTCYNLRMSDPIPRGWTNPWSYTIIAQEEMPGALMPGTNSEELRWGEWRILLCDYCLRTWELSTVICSLPYNGTVYCIPWPRGIRYDNNSCSGPSVRHCSCPKPRAQRHCSCQCENSNTWPIQAAHPSPLQV
jgi:hypothetical protein